MRAHHGRRELHANTGVQTAAKPQSNAPRIGAAAPRSPRRGPSRAGSRRGSDAAPLSRRTHVRTCARPRMQVRAATHANARRRACECAPPRKRAPPRMQKRAAAHASAGRLVPSLWTGPPGVAPQGGSQGGSQGTYTLRAAVRAAPPVAREGATPPASPRLRAALPAAWEACRPGRGRPGGRDTLVRPPWASTRESPPSLSRATFELRDGRASRAALYLYPAARGA
jgi:hypothetical protein